MKLLTLNNGSAIPALGYGTWQLIGDQCIDGVKAAIDMGYRHIDTAQIYENEAEVGKGIESAGVARRELFVTTKLWMNHFAPKEVLSSTDISLQKLKLEYVDLLLIHWPDTQVPLKDTLAAMAQLVKEGKTKAIGVSNFPVQWMQNAVEASTVPITCNQVEYHVMLNQKPVLDFAKKHNMVVTAYSPLGRGKFSNHPILADIGAKYGKTPNQVALRWLVQQENVAAIPKAASRAHMKANFEIFDFALDANDLQQLATLSGNNRYINPDFAPKWDTA